jgi:hypothetical protein
MDDTTYSEADQPIDVAVLSPRADVAEALAWAMTRAEAENWAPFRAWRGRLGDARALVLVTGTGRRAAVSGALSLLTTCPGAPIVQIDACLVCDPSLPLGEPVAIASAHDIDKQDLYLLHASPTPLGDLPAATPDAGLLTSINREDSPASVVAGSCDAAIDFPTQLDWLHGKYGFQVVDAISCAVGRIVSENGGAWLALGIPVAMADLRGATSDPGAPGADAFGPAVQKVAAFLARLSVRTGGVR